MTLIFRRKNKFYLTGLLTLILVMACNANAAEDNHASNSPAANSFRDCPDCPEMVIIPSGSLLSESSNGRDEENSTPRISIERSFALEKTKVTQGQWKAVMGNNPSDFSNCGDDCPVESVSWNDAQEFIRKLNAKTGKQYRLPTATEWEYACYGGIRTKYCGGNDPETLAWTDSNSYGYPHPVGLKQANGYGLLDMSGDVWEWTSDCDSSNCVLRGGSWGYDQQYARAAIRARFKPTYRSSCDGFRVARVLP